MQKFEPLPVLVLAESHTRFGLNPNDDSGEARESTENCDRSGEGSSMADSCGGQTLSQASKPCLEAQPFTPLGCSAAASNSLSLGTCEDCGDLPAVNQWHGIYVCDECLQFRKEG